MLAQPGPRGKKRPAMRSVGNASGDESSGDGTPAARRTLPTPIVPDKSMEKKGSWVTRQLLTLWEGDAIIARAPHRDPKSLSSHEVTPVPMLWRV